MPLIALLFSSSNIEEITNAPISGRITKCLASYEQVYGATIERAKYAMKNETKIKMNKIDFLSFVNITLFFMET